MKFHTTFFRNFCQYQRNALSLDSGYAAKGCNLDKKVL
jgi:hypothetical protein